MVGVYTWNIPVDGVSICGSYELLQKVLDVPAEPLVPLLQVKHLVHQQQHHTQWDVIVHLQKRTLKITMFIDQEHKLYILLNVLVLLQQLQTNLIN